MGINRTKGVGLILIVVAVLVWGYYTYNLLVAGQIIPNFVGIPILNEFWIIAFPMFLIMTAFFALMIWLGLSTFTAPEPRVTAEELQKLEELERLARAKRMARQQKEQDTA